MDTMPLTIHPIPGFVLICDMRRFLFTLALTLQAANSAGLIWNAWTPDLFARARQENKFVLLDLEAVWCHWCHVMDETTYKDPTTIALLNSKYILVRVDQDSRPDLANRYEDYGWPATIVFDANGQEIVKRRGYIAPRQMASMLEAIIKDPTPGPSVEPEQPIEYAANATVTPAQRSDLAKRYLANYDRKNGSWGSDQKFLDWDAVEYALALTREGDAGAERMARQTLDAQFNLIDPVWGGVYQYSTGGNWKEPHFEKVMQFQAANIRIYSLAYEQFQEPKYKKAALDVYKFLKTFLISPEGEFYTSMNADVIDGQHSASYFKLNDAGRRRIGVPRIDKHIYSRENGWAIEALASLYEATGDAMYLDEAKRAAGRIIATRSLEGGGFRHDEADAAGPFLGDTLSMSRAFLKLYASTADRAWLGRAQAGLHFIAANFSNTNGAGFTTYRTVTEKVHPERDENVSLARLANLVSQYTGNETYRKIADEAMRFIATPAIADRNPAAGLLLADRELTRPPTHLTIVGSKKDETAARLFETALQYASGYKRVEWWDRAEGPLPNPDVEYPQLAQPAAFVCTQKSCSSPIRKPEQLLSRANQLAQ
jgi:uncharacterized protein YyaL (SSP411 family)